jgi:hypothetical protein
MPLAALTSCGVREVLLRSLAVSKLLFVSPTEGAIGPRFLPSMWECAPYSALTATLKIRNVTAQKFAEEPCSYGPRAVRLPVPNAQCWKPTMPDGEIAATVKARPAKARAR